MTEFVASAKEVFFLCWSSLGRHLFYHLLWSIFQSKGTHIFFTDYNSLLGLWGQLPCTIAHALIPIFFIQNDRAEPFRISPQARIDPPIARVQWSTEWESWSHHGWIVLNNLRGLRKDDQTGCRKYIFWKILSVFIVKKTKFVYVQLLDFRKTRDPLGLDF